MSAVHSEQLLLKVAIHARVGQVAELVTLASIGWPTLWRRTGWCTGLASGETAGDHSSLRVMVECLGPSDR